MRTAKEASKLSGRSITWLRTHACMWCGQSALNGLRYGCGAIFGKCEPEKRDYHKVMTKTDLKQIVCPSDRKDG